MDVSLAFGIAIRKLRRARDLTQKGLGFEAGLRRTFISSLELVQKQPSIATIQKLADTFGISMAELMELTENELPK